MCNRGGKRTIPTPASNLFRRRSGTTHAEKVIRREDERDDAALLRFPISFYGKERADILRLALSRGLYLETNFEDLLPEKSEHGRFPNAVWAARNLVLLPLYAALSLRRAERLAQQVVGLTAPAPSTAAPVKSR